MHTLSDEILLNLGIKIKKYAEGGESLSVPSPVSASPTLADIPPDTYEFGDIDGFRKRLYEKLKKAVAEAPPIQYGNYELRFEDVDYSDPEIYSIEDEHKALITGRDLVRRLKGRVVLRDVTTGKILDQRNMTLLRVPYVTRFGTFVLGGSSYAIVNQQRMRPGIYVRVRERGDVEAFVNVAGTGQHAYELDPERGVFYMEYKQAHVPLYPVLKALGVDDEKIKAAWGEELYKRNVAATSKSNIGRLFPRIKDQEQLLQALQQFFENAKLDPSVSLSTLGKPYDRVTPDAILAATQKMVNVYQGKVPPDERDAMFYQRVVGPEDILEEAIQKYHNNLKKYVLRAVRKNNSLSVIPGGVYDQALHNVIIGSGLSELLEEINPGEAYDRQFRVVKTGEGGIENERAIPLDARGVHPSQMGYIDPTVTAAQMRAGVDNRAAWLTRRGADGKLYTLYKDVKSGKFVWRAPNDLLDAVIAFPGELQKKGKYVLGTRAGQVWYFKPEEVDYELPFGEQYFTPLSNFIPLLGSAYPHRVLMGQKAQLQALPLVNREAPLVQGKIPIENESFQRKAAKYYGAVFSDVDGTVEQVSAKSIVIRDNKGQKHQYELFNNYPFNRKTFIYNIPKVKPGDRVTKKQLLATSNFTDDEGVPAFGINAYAAFLPYRGYNFEDAYVISQSFANKLMSELMYQESLDLDGGIITGKDKFRSLFPGKYTEEFYSRYDDNGILKPGQTVQKGQPLILAAREADLASQVGRKRYFTDASVIWDHDHEGKVVDTYAGKKFFYINAITRNGTYVGDKITGRFGDKGIIAKVVPDEEMPRDSQGRIFDLLINPLALVTRANNAQIYEMMLAKIAKQTGKPYLVPAFADDAYRYVDAELKAHGVSPTETVYDPVLNVKIPNVLTGYKYVMKLHHIAESKLQERATGAYTSEGLPAKGGDEGAKRIGLLELYGILGHNAYHVIRDAKLIRGQENQEFWLDFQRGGNPPIREQTFVYDKFVNMLRGAGINLTSDNRYLHLYALTDDDIKRLTGGRRLTNSETVRLLKDDLKLVPGGLFDPSLTGGSNGRFWSYIELPEPMPSPVMEEVIRTLLGLTEQEYLAVLQGKAPSPITSKPGPEGILEDLKQINVDKEIRNVIGQIKVAPQSILSKLTRKLRYLLAIKKSGQKPESWVWTRLPVIPPAFRPISSSMGTLVVADVNALYQDAFEAADILRQQKDITDDLADARLALYNAIKAVAGLGDPIQAKHKQQDLQGFIRQILGSSAKWNYVLRKLISPTTDLTGRAVIAPNPSLDMDHVGIPVEQAWTLFRPFIIRELVKRGARLPEAVKYYNDKHPLAVDALLKAMKDRVVVINRAPVLHRYGELAFKPVLTKNKVIEFNPQIIVGMAADFDGDAVQIHVPVSEEAQAEAKEKMLPSKNLFSSARFDIVNPAKNEYVAGLWLATTRVRPGPPKVFRSRKDAIRAYNRGEIEFDTPIRISEE
jgi:DNA-directed RNA polymerase beta subunit